MQVRVPAKRTQGLSVEGEYHEEAISFEDIEKDELASQKEYDKTFPQRVSSI